MRETSLSPHVGNVVCLDLANGKDVVGRVESVINGQVKLRYPMQFVPVAVDPRTGKHQVGTMPYGGPLHEPMDTKFIEFDCAHVVAVLKIQPGMEAKYMEITSGIVPASSLPDPPAGPSMPLRRP
jgi:hypothetical protein